MQGLSQRVLWHIRRQDLIRPGQRVAVAVSGGADSLALLRLLAELKKELGIILFAAHFNHRLRGCESDGDQKFVEDLCTKLRIELLVESGDVPAFAARDHLSIETAARRLRYHFFEESLASQRLDSIATAHTLDDQAETVLMKFIRGAGTRGLAGIYPQRKIGEGAIIRPLLDFRRAELEHYLKSLNQDWREDSSNLDLHHVRNRVRRSVLPMIEAELNPSVRERLFESAEIAREEDKFWEAETAKVVGRVACERGILVAAFRLLPIALQRRVMLAVAGSLGVQLTFRHVMELCELAAFDEARAECSLPDGWRAKRIGNRIELVAAQSGKPESYDYDYPLILGEENAVPEIGCWFELTVADFSPEYNPRDCLPVHLTTQALRVRNWRAGDRFEPAHSGGPKKIKELLQEMHISGTARKLWPVILAGDEIVWLRDLASPYCPKVGDKVIVVRETPQKAEC